MVMKVVGNTVIRTQVVAAAIENRNVVIVEFVVKEGARRAVHCR